MDLEPLTVPTATVKVTGSHFRKGICLRMGPAVGSRGRGGKRAKRVGSCVTVPRLMAWRPIPRFLRPRRLSIWCYHTRACENGSHRRSRPVELAHRVQGDPRAPSEGSRSDSPYVGTTGALLAYRVPVEFLDQLRTIEHLFPEWNGVHHSN